MLFVFPKPVIYKSYPTANFTGKPVYLTFIIQKNHGWIILQQMITLSIRMCVLWNCLGSQHC